MAGKSPNSKTNIKHLRRGLSIYKTGRTPYWHARIYDAASKKYVVRSTKETSRLQAAEVAEEILADHKSKQNPNYAAQKDRSFEYYATLLVEIARVQSKGKKNKYAFSDQYKVLYREGDGIVSYFGKYDVGMITSGMVRDYLVFLDKRREAPLAPSTKAKQCMMIRKVLMLALEDGVIDIIPPMPKQRIIDKPRPSFSNSEYKKLITTARKIAKAGDTKVRGVLVQPEHADMWTFMVHSFLRPTESELFGLRFRDVEKKGHLANEKDPLHLELKIQGKTGFRISATMTQAAFVYDAMLEKNLHPNPDDYLFMPEYSNRTTAVNTARRIFNHFLDVSGLKLDASGNSRSPYSLRHYALQARLRGSKGEVNIYWLARNAGTSVDQLERFYLKNMALSQEQIVNLHSGW